MNEEVWKPVVGYEGLYEVSNLGNVRSLNYMRKGYKKDLKQVMGNRGYFVVGIKGKAFLVHRIVASAFFHNYELKRTVNHKDGNKLNNSIDNLEWATDSENIKHSYYTGLRKPVPSKMKGVNGFNHYLSKSVGQYSLEGELIKIWGSVRVAGYELGFAHQNISNCCRNNSKSSYGFIWKYI